MPDQPVDTTISAEAQQRFKVEFAEKTLLLHEALVTIDVLRNRIADLQAQLATAATGDVKMPAPSGKGGAHV